MSRNKVGDMIGKSNYGPMGSTLGVGPQINLVMGLVNLVVGLINLIIGLWAQL